MNALDIAKGLESNGEDCTCHASCYYECACDAVWGEAYTLNAAAELRRLHELNQELVKALIELEEAARCLQAGEWPSASIQPERTKAQSAIAKATGENK